MPPISMKSKMLLYQTHFSQEGVQAERGGEAAHPRSMLKVNTRNRCSYPSFPLDSMLLLLTKNDSTNAIFHQAIHTHHFLQASNHTYCGHIVSKVLLLS